MGLMPTNVSTCSPFTGCGKAFIQSSPLEQEAMFIDEMLTDEKVTDAAGNALQNATTQSSGIKEHAVITSISGVAVACKSYGIGAAILQNTAGALSYSASMTTATSWGATFGMNPAAWSSVQYLGALTAKKAATTAVNATILGVSAGTFATAVFAIGTGLIVGEAQALFNNTFIAKNESEKMSYNPIKWGMTAFSAITGVGAQTAAASA